MVQAAVESGLPLDISSNPALWGGYLQRTDAVISVAGTSAFEHANDETHATDLVSAHLIECLSCIGREYLDFYFVRLGTAVEEFQISGVLQAMEIAKQEGHVRHIGLYCAGPAFASLAMWQFHDAFEALLVPRNHRQSDKYSTLAPLAAQRRVGVVTCSPFNWGYDLPFFDLPEEWRVPNLTKSFYGMSLAQAVLAQQSKEHTVLVGVRSTAQVLEAVQALTLNPPDGLWTALDHFKEAYDSDEVWDRVGPNSSPALQRAAQKRRRVLDV